MCMLRALGSHQKRMPSESGSERSSGAPVLRRPSNWMAEQFITPCRRFLSALECLSDSVVPALGEAAGQPQAPPIGCIDSALGREEENQVTPCETLLASAASTIISYAKETSCQQR